MGILFILNLTLYSRAILHISIRDFMCITMLLKLSFVVRDMLCGIILEIVNMNIKPL